MAMIIPMATAAIIASRNNSGISLEIIRSRFIRQLKGYIRDNTKFVEKCERFTNIYGDNSSPPTVKITKELIRKQVAELIKQVNEGNKTLEKRKKIQKTFWYSKLSTKERFLANLGLIKQPLVKGV